MLQHSYRHNSYLGISVLTSDLLSNFHVLILIAALSSNPYFTDSEMESLFWTTWFYAEGGFWHFDWGKLTSLINFGSHPMASAPQSSPTGPVDAVTYSLHGPLCPSAMQGQTTRSWTQPYAKGPHSMDFFWAHQRHSERDKADLKGSSCVPFHTGWQLEKLWTEDKACTRCVLAQKWGQQYSSGVPDPRFNLFF